MLHTTMVCHAINTALLSHSNTKEVQQSLKFPQLERFISRPYLVRSHLFYSVASVCRRLCRMYCG